MLTLANTITTRLMGYRGMDDRGGYTLLHDERRRRYAYADALYDNMIYEEDCGSHQRKEIFRRVTGRKRKSVQEFVGYINPITGIVDTYQHCIRGRLGQELKLVRDGQELAADITEDIRGIWRDSRLDLMLEPFQHYAASYGPSFLRVIADERVRIVPWHPKKVVDLIENDAGAITEALLEYEVLEGPLNGDRTPVVYRERLTKDRFERWEDGREADTKQIIDNPLGFVPLAMVRHSNKGRDIGQNGDLGLPAWQGSDGQVHMVNIRMSQLGLAVDKALWTKWFIAASGSSPETINLSGEQIINVKLNTDDATPIIKAINEPIDANAALKQIDLLMANLIAKQPEMVLSHLDAISGQSGETIRKLLTPVASRIVDARRKYEATLTASIAQAVSWRRLLAGQSRMQVDEDYRNGGLEFGFADRPALPPTPEEIIADANAQYAERMAGFKVAAAGKPLVGSEEALKSGGYSDADAAKFAAIAEAKEAAAAADKLTAIARP